MGTALLPLGSATEKSSRTFAEEVKPDSRSANNIVAKAVNGMPTKRAMAWAEDQVKLAVQGKLKREGKAS